MLTHINDLHVGVGRSGGTTPASAYALRMYVLDELFKLLQQTNDDLVVNGDLFDSFLVPMHDFLQTYFMFRDWLIKHPGKRLILVPGNHDLSKNATLKSSFDALAMLLYSEFRTRVAVVNEPTTMHYEGVTYHFIPHMPNQELFDLALTRVPVGTKYLFLHCNYDNKFAMQQDHSLNLSPDQARAAPVERIIIAHEHQRKIALTGKVILPGNQIPTSVADCLGNADKHYLRLLPDKIEHIPVWQRDKVFTRADWRELVNVGPDWQFVRVEGTATAAEAGLVVQQIAKLRSTHKAFVISNAVQIEGNDLSKLSVSLEQIKQFDVLTALLKYLSPAEGKVVKKLLEED